MRLKAPAAPPRDTALTRGERVARDGVFTSRSGTGEGSLPRCTHPTHQTKNSGRVATVGAVLGSSVDDETNGWRCCGWERPRDGKAPSVATTPYLNVRVEKEFHEFRASQSSSSLAGATISPSIRIVAAREPSQCFFLAAGAGSTTSATGCPNLVTPIGRRLLRTRSRASTRAAPTPADSRFRQPLPANKTLIISQHCTST
jgi:hypothetical protein